MTVTGKRFGYSIALVLGAALSLPAQTVPQEQAEPQQTAQPGQFQQLQQAEPRVVATVNGEPITARELDSVFARQLAAIQQQLPADQQLEPAMVQELRQQLLANLIDSRLVEQYVIEEGPDVEREEIDATVDQVKEQVESQGMQYNEFLAAQALTEESFEKRIEGSLAWQKFHQEAVTDEKLQAFFEENQEQFAAASFSEARPEVAQAYTATVWEGILEKVRPNAEIEMMEQPGEARSPAGQAFPGGVPQQQE